MFAPQKGATVRDVHELDAALELWAELVSRTSMTDVRGDTPGAGAAGGLAFGLTAALGARITSGVDLLLELTGFHDVVRGAALVVVGEGSLDAQSLCGKGPVGIARALKKTGPPVVAVVGRCMVDHAELLTAGIRAVYELSDLESNESESMSHADALLETLGRHIAEDQVMNVGRC
jgi:glycerate kinase